MGRFDSESADNLRVREGGAGDRLPADLRAMADGLDAAAALKEAAAREQARTAKDMHAVAAIAKEMHSAITDNTETMRDMSAAVEGAAARAENASNEVYARVEERAVKTLSDIDRAARIALENSQRNVDAAVRELEAMRKAALAAIAAACAVASAVFIIILLVAIGAMWMQLKLGVGWVSEIGWLSIPLTMTACGVLGYAIACAKHKA